MEKISYHNLVAVAIGLLIIMSGCLIAYYSQKKLFNKLRGKVPNSREKDDK